MDSLTLSKSQWDQMRAHVARLAPLEACGLVAGLGNRVAAVIPVANVLSSKLRYRMDPMEQLRAFEWMDQSGFELIGIFHSHPSGPPEPSATDVAEAYYPEAVYLIWSLETESWSCRGFRIEASRVREIPILLGELE